MTMSADERSAAARVMDEAIDLAIEGRSPYPEKASFIEADTPYTDKEAERAAKEGYAVVLVSADGSTRILQSPPNLP